MVEITKGNMAARMMIITGEDHLVAVSALLTRISAETTQEVIETCMTAETREWADVILKTPKTGSVEETMIATAIGTDMIRVNLPAVDTQTLPLVWPLKILRTAPRTEALVEVIMDDQTTEGPEHQTMEGREDPIMEEAITVTAVMEGEIVKNVPGGIGQPTKYLPGLEMKMPKDEEKGTRIIGERDHAITRVPTNASRKI
jgi:hypothetical protein